MRIRTDGYPNGVPAAGELDSRDVGGAAPASSRVRERDSLKVTVSEKARSLASGTIDETKVARLRDAIQKGTFSFDARKLAATIVEGG